MLALVAVLTASAQQTQGPVLRFAFDGSVEATVGKEFGPPRMAGTPKFVEGRFGKALSLTDGAHLVVKLPQAVQRCEFSISFWVKPLWHPSDNLPHPLLEIPANPDKTDAIGWAPAQFFVSKGWSETIAPNNVYGVVDSGIATRNLRPGQWTHILIVYSLSGKYQASYFNGEGHRREAGKAMAAHNVHKNEMFVGARANGRGRGDIVIDELRLYDRPIEQAEIPAVAGATFPPPRDYLSLGQACDPAKAVPTPHVAWAKPLAGGGLRVLCISEGIRAREFIELAQRVEIEPVVLTTPSHGPGILVNPKLFEALGVNVQAALAEGNIDCVLVGAFAWNLVPEKTRDAILAYVRKGGGLVFVDPRCLAVGPQSSQGIIQWFSGKMWIGWARTPEGKAIEALVERLARVDEEHLTATTPWQALPMLAGQLENRQRSSLFRGGRVDKGRILLYYIAAGPGNSPCALTPARAEYDPLDYDYAIGVAARAVLWASGRDNPVRIRQVAYQNFRKRDAFSKVNVGSEPGDWIIDIDNGLDNPISVRLTLTTRSRSPLAPPVETKDLRLKPGPNRIAIRQALTQVGTTFADVRLLLDNTVADWASGVVEVVPGNPSIRALTLARPSYAPGETPQVHAKLALRKYDVIPGRTGELRWTLCDAYGRAVQRGNVHVRFDPHDEFTTDVSWLLLPLDDSSLCYTLSVDLASRGKVTDQRSLTVPCRQDQVDDFAFFSWQGGSSAVGTLATQVLRDRYGLNSDGVSCHGRPVDELLRRSLERVARSNLRPWIYSTHIGSYGKPGEVRKPDGADPAYLEKLHERMAAVARIAEPYSPLFYGLGDETKMGPPDALASGHEQEAFRLHLMGRYGKIESLNSAWGTDYKAWTEIVIPAPEQLTKGGALVGQVLPFRKGLYAGIMGMGTAGVHSVAPGARVGVEGIFGLSQAYTGLDYWKITRNCTFVGLYDSSLLSGSSGMQRDIVRSFLEPGELLGVWWNYEKLNPEYSRYGPWHVLLRGTHAFGYFTNYCPSQYTMLNPDFTAFDQFQWTYEELAPLLAGVGKLIVGLQRDDLGIAVLYNQRNLDRNSPMFRACIVMTKLLQDLGIQHDFVHGDQIAAGELLRRGTKVLVLPGQGVMEDPVAAGIRQFVANGGALVTDVLPGNYDGVRKREKRPLDDLFADRGTLKGNTHPQSPEDVAAWKTHRKALDQGETLFFGDYASWYNLERLGAKGAFLRQIVAAFLADHGVTAAARVGTPDGSFHPLTTVTYHDGPNLYVGIQREYAVPDPTPRTFEVVATAKAHVYDVIAGKYLGETDRAALELEVARGRLVAFLSCKATGLSVRGVPATCRQGDRIALDLALETSGGRPAHGVFRVEILGPNGRRIAPLCCKLRWTGGIANRSLPIAWNDPPGDWTLTVTDIATGTSAREVFRVEARKP